MAPKHSLGQHFLTSPHIAQDMATVLPGCSGATVLEIGPGKGILTEALLARGRRVVAIEKDAALIPLLSERFAHEIDCGVLHLIEGDALAFETLAPFLLQAPYVVAANIPYNITGAIIRTLFSAPRQPEALVLLVQREVAERVVAKHGKQSILSLSVAAYGIPRMVRIVHAGSFFPKPRVDSAVIAVERISRAAFRTSTEEALFFSLIKAGFSHKRKRLSSNLATLFPKTHVEDLLSDAGISKGVRAEDVPLVRWLSLTRTCVQAGYAATSLRYLSE